MIEQGIIPEITIISKSLELSPEFIKIQQELSNKYSFIRSKRNEMEQPQPKFVAKTKRMWTQEEVKYISEHYGIISILDMAKILGSTYYQVRIKIQNNGMKPNGNIK